MYQCVTVTMANGLPSANGTADPGTLAVGTYDTLAMKVPSDNLGGGITIVDCSAMCSAAIAAASAPQFDVIAVGSGGTGVIANGTICAFGSIQYTAGTPVQGTLTTTWIDNDASHYWIYIRHKQTADLTLGSAVFRVSIGYQQGR